MTLNTTQLVNIPRSTVAVQIRNDSRFDVLISFAYTAPSNTANSTDGSWQEVALRHTNPVVPVQTPGTGPYEKQTNGIGGNFLGNLWLCPTNNNAANLALSGIYSSLDNVWVTCYDPGDDIPDSDATTRTVDIVNQPRIVMVPPVPGLGRGHLFLNSATNTYQDAGSSLGQVSGIAYAGSATSYNFYLYAVCVSMRNTAASFQYQAVLLSFQIFDSLNNMVGTVTNSAFDTFLQSVGDTAAVSFSPGYPCVFQQFVPGSITNLPLRAAPVILSGGGSAGYPFSCDWTLYWDVAANGGQAGPGGPFGGVIGALAAPYGGGIY